MYVSIIVCLNCAYTVELHSSLHMRVWVWDRQETLPDQVNIQQNLNNQTSKHALFRLTKLSVVNMRKTLDTYPSAP